MKKDTTQIYSLTARSLPREVRQKLRSDETSMDYEGKYRLAVFTKVLNLSVFRKYYRTKGG